MAYHILLVDDAPELRRMVGELLEGAGYAVTLAADCAQARRAWTESQPDAALLDVMLPDGDGFSLLEELRRVGNGVPVLFLSARDEDEARLRGLGLGADDYITKPFLPQELLLRLAAVLRRVYGAGAGEVLRLGAAEVHWGTGTVRRPGGGCPHRQGVRPAQKAGGQPGKHRHHRRPVPGPVGGAHGGL